MRTFTDKKYCVVSEDEIAFLAVDGSNDPPISAKQKVLCLTFIDLSSSVVHILFSETQPLLDIVLIIKCRSHEKGLWIYF